MIHYKDMTFCDFYKECKKGKKCNRSLTKDVIELAKKWWNGNRPPICRFANKPECFEGINEKREIKPDSK